MKFKRLKLRGMGATFREIAELDIEALPGPLVAICGEIGSGKSVALECLMGAIDRTTPTRGRLGDLATARDSMVEVSVHNGRDFTIRHTMDAVSDKGESLVMDAEGEPLVKSGKRRDFDKWSSEHFPPANVRMASTFGAQKSEGFIDLKEAARKDVILSVKGCDHFHAMSTESGEIGREVASELVSTVDRINMLKDGESVPAIQSEIAKLEHEVSMVTERRAGYAARLEEARIAHATYATDLERHEERTRKRRELDEEIRAKRTKLEGIRERITNNETVIASAEAIRSAADRKPKVEGERAALAEANAKAAAELTAARDRRTELRTIQQTQVGRIKRADEVITTGLASIEDWQAEIKTSKAALPIEVAAELDAAEAASGHEDEEARLAKLFLNSKDDRIKALRGVLNEILHESDSLASMSEEASVGLHNDDVAAKEAEEAPHKQAAAGRAHRDALRVQSTHHREAERLGQLIIAREDKIDSTTDRVKTSREDRDAARIRLAEVEAGMAVADAEIKDRSSTVAENAAATRKLTEELAKIEPLAKRSLVLEQAEARVEELRPQIDQLNSDITAARAELDGLGPPAPAPAPPSNIEELEAELRRCDSVIDRDKESFAEARHRLARREQDDAAAAKFEEKQLELEADLSDWRLLQRDLGRDGLQALEVDAAGPELTELANDLLHSCLGSRFSVRIDTTHKSSDGKRDIEDCLVNVTDTEQGHDGEVREFSGGERGLIGEAIDLALTMVGVRASGISAPTIVRDERGASQSADSERAYIAMLRRAAEIIGAPHVLFVSHREATRSLADSRVTIDGGQFHVS